MLKLEALLKTFKKRGITIRCTAKTLQKKWLSKLEPLLKKTLEKKGALKLNALLKT